MDHKNKEPKLSRRDFLKGVGLIGGSVLIESSGLGRITGAQASPITSLLLPDNSKPFKESLSMFSPEKSLAKEDVRVELLNYYSALAQKYTVNDGSYRLQYPGDPISQGISSRAAEAAGEYFAGTGRVIEGNLDMLDDVVKRANADVQRFGASIDNQTSVIDAAFLLRGVAIGKGAFMSKLNELRVDYNGNIVDNGPLSMKDYWAQKLTTVINNSGDFKADHASYRLIAKTVLSSLFSNTPALSDWARKDIQTIRDSEFGDGVFIDKSVPPGPVSQYTITIQENLHCLHRYFQGDLERANAGWYSGDELRNRAIPYLNNMVNFVSREGKTITWGPSFTTAADPVILVSYLDLAAEYAPNLIPKLKALLKQSLLYVSNGGNYIFPGLTSDAAAIEPGVDKAVATVNYLAALGRYLNLPDNVLNSSEADPTPAGGSFYWPAGGILRYLTPDGTLKTILVRPMPNSDKRSGVRAQNSFFPPEGKDAWIGDRPINYGMSAVRYKEGMPGNLCYITDPEAEVNVEVMDNGAWIYIRGNLTEYAEGLGKGGRRTDMLGEEIIIVSGNAEIHLFRVTANGKSIQGINQSSLPLPVDRDALAIAQQINNGWKINYPRNGGNPSILGMPLWGINTVNSNYRFGGSDGAQRPPKSPGNVSMLYGAPGNGQEKQVIGSVFYYHKNDSFDLNAEAGYVSVLEADSNRVVLNIGGKKYSADFEERSVDKEFSVNLGPEQKFDNWQIPNTPDGRASFETRNGRVYAWMPSEKSTVYLEGPDIQNLSLVDTVLSPDAGRDADYWAINSIARLPDGTMVGFTHTEDHNPNAQNFKARIQTILSRDNGRTWDRNSVVDIIRGDFPYDVNAPTVNGAGEPSAIIKDGQIYLYYVDWTSGQTQLRLTTAPVSDFMRPDAWKKYPQPVINAPTPQDYWAALPVVSFNDKLNRFLMFFETDKGIYRAVSKDGIHWSEAESVLPYPKPTSQGFSIRYHTFVTPGKESNLLTGGSGLFIYSKDMGGPHFPVYRPLQINSNP